MRGNRLTKLWGRRAPLGKDIEEALARLTQIGEQQPDLKILAATNAALIETMYAHPLPMPHVAIDTVHAATKREAGVPLLRGEPIIFDAAAVRVQFVHLCRVMEDQGNPFAAPLARAVKAGTLPIDDLATEVIAGEPQTIQARAGHLDLDAGLAATLLRLTLFPLLEQLVKDLQPVLDTSAWRRGYCPACGSWPLLGEYRGLEVTRFLRCGLCALEWEIDRLVCFVCETRLHQDLLNLAVEGEEAKQRAVACERCHCYVKQLSTLVPIPGPQLLVMDLATLHLDLAALERGYAPPQ